MPKAKPKNPGTVAICINVPVKLMKRLDKELAALRRHQEYAYISRSAFLSHALAEWVAILDNPARLPESPQAVRRRLRPAPRTTPNGMSKLDAAKVRALRRDTRGVRAVASDLGLSPSTVSRARSGATWAWVE